MGLDLLARQRPTIGAPVIETISLAELDAVQVRAIRHRSPADGKVGRNQRREIPDGIVLARQYPHRRAEFRARAKQEGTAPDVARAIDDLLRRIFGSDDSCGMLDVAL